MIIHKDRIGLTLLEIIVAMLILSLVMYGLVSLFTVSKRFVYHSGSRVVSMELGKYFFEGENMTVSASVYPIGNCLYNNSLCQPAAMNFNAIDFNVTYFTDNVTKGSSADNTTLRKVVMNVTWFDPDLK